MSSRFSFVVAVVLAGLMALVGCGPDGGGGGGFVALAKDFEGYSSWSAFPVDAPDGGFSNEDATDGGDVHAAGPRTVFINRLPDAGTTSWPVGTIIVKEAPFHTFAMVKRGNGYNAKGAQGWEWFDLVSSPSTGIAIKWRGLGPPAGENYGATSTTCNDCHRGNTKNDSVLSPKLQLLGQ